MRLPVPTQRPARAPHPLASAEAGCPASGEGCVAGLVRARGWARVEAQELRCASCGVAEAPR